MGVGETLLKFDTKNTSGGYHPLPKRGAEITPHPFLGRPDSSLNPFFEGGGRFQKAQPPSQGERVAEPTHSGGNDNSLSGSFSLEKIKKTK